MDDKLVFIRHTGLSGGPKMVDAIKKGGYVGIHYADNGWNPSEYVGSGKEALERFVELGEKGGYVLASYGGPLVFGHVAAQKRLPVDTTPDSPLGWVKLLKFEKIRDIEFQEAPLLHGLQPRQGTIMQSTLIGDIFRAVNNGESPTWQWLGATGLEVLCSEWLRANGLLDHFLTPIGRTLKDVDIIGIKGDRKVLAQVTGSHQSNSGTKAKCLKVHRGPNTDLYFFCDFKSADLAHTPDDVIKWKAVAEVFAEMTKSYPKFLKELLKPAEVLRVPKAT